VRENVALRLLDRIPNKRESLARALGAVGVPGLLERTAQRPALVVLTYHRIAEPGVRFDPYYDPVISATPESFARQLAFLRGRYQPVPLEDLLDRDALAAAASRARKPLLHVTFDDGYRDNVTAALPILEQLGVPATFFIPTGFLDEPGLPWWDHVAYVLKRTQARRLVLGRHPDDPEPVEITLGSEPADGVRVAAIRRVIGLFLAHAIPDERWFLGQLQEQAGVPVDGPALGRALFLDRRQLRDLAEAGMAVGSHGVAHVVLGRLDGQAQRHELGESKRVLEEVLGRAVVAVAYPYGWPGTFTPETERLAAEAGYRLGFSSIEGVNHPGSGEFEPLRLRRLNVGTGDSGPLLRARAALHGRFGRSFL
jgi:peptidoglycan/xylan/chitin deacetylase (PgdA/CDA1 family)